MIMIMIMMITCIYIYIYMCMCTYDIHVYVQPTYVHIYIYIYMYYDNDLAAYSNAVSRSRALEMASAGEPNKSQRHINRVVSNGFVPKSHICKLVAKPAPDIFRIQGVYHNEGFWRDKAALLIRPCLIRPGLCSPKIVTVLNNSNRRS